MIAEVSLGQILFAIVIIVIFNNVTILMAIYGKEIFKS